MTDARQAPDPEFQALVRSQYAGNPRAMSALGARLVVGNEAPRAPADGAALIAQAAQEGDVEAWRHLSVLAAAGVARAQSWPDAFDALDRASGLGDTHAADELRVLREIGVARAADVAQWLNGFESTTLRDAPWMIACPELAPRQVCEYLIARARPKLAQAKVYDAASGGLKLDAMRTNKGAVFSIIESDVVIELVRARIARAAGVGLETFEPPEVLHYSVGEQYRPHVDFFHPAVPNFAEQMRVKGQRVKTCLVYLNDDLEGGETDFPKLGLKFRGRSGEALVFTNVRPNGAGDMSTIHCGLPPTRGEKWLLSQWIRNKRQPVA